MKAYTQFLGSLVQEISRNLKFSIHVEQELLFDTPYFIDRSYIKLISACVYTHKYAHVYSSIIYIFKFHNA